MPFRPPDFSDPRALVARRAVLLGVGAAWGLTACGGAAGRDAPASSTSPPTSASTPTPSATSATSATSSATASAAGSVLPPGLTEADVAAGVLSAEILPVAGTELVTVPGSAPAPGPGRVRTLRVQVERGLLDDGLVDGAVFAAFALGVLNDPRGWGAGATMSFARTDADDAEFRLVLASPETSAALCSPLRTFGRLSCRQGDAAIITSYRWVQAIPDYGTDRTGYRQYVVNHEVGHLLGHGHDPNPGVGRRAPVMMQQTKGLDGALPNPWPFPDA